MSTRINLTGDVLVIDNVFVTPPVSIVFDGNTIVETLENGDTITTTFDGDTITVVLTGSLDKTTVYTFAGENITSVTT